MRRKIFETLVMGLALISSNVLSAQEKRGADHSGGGDDIIRSYVRVYDLAIDWLVKLSLAETRTISDLELGFFMASKNPNRISPVDEVCIALESNATGHSRQRVVVPCNDEKSLTRVTAAYDAALDITYVSRKLYKFEEKFDDENVPLWIHEGARRSLALSPGKALDDSNYQISKLYRLKPQTPIKKPAIRVLKFRGLLQGDRDFCFERLRYLPSGSSDIGLDQTLKFTCEYIGGTVYDIIAHVVLKNTSAGVYEFKDGQMYAETANAGLRYPIGFVTDETGVTLLIQEASRRTDLGLRGSVYEATLIVE
jgi:hypothetical protein